MNREIKFRFYDKREGFMINEFQLNINDSVRTVNTLFLSFQRDNYEVMQYVGLKDKNGIGIYEGDILRTAGVDPESARKVEVYYNEEMCMFRVRHESTQFDDPLYFYNAWAFNGFEVIGNIYDNPELLKGGE